MASSFAPALLYNDVTAFVTCPNDDIVAAFNSPKIVAIHDKYNIVVDVDVNVVVVVVVVAPNDDNNNIKKTSDRMNMIDETIATF